MLHHLGSVSPTRYLLIAPRLRDRRGLHNGLVHPFNQHPVASRNPVDFDVVPKKPETVTAALAAASSKPLQHCPCPCPQQELLSQRNKSPELSLPRN